MSTSYSDKKEETMIIHVPHASRKFENLVELTNEEENLDFLTDDYVEEIFSIAPYEVLRFPYSRFVCDVERFRENDPMEKKGQGVIYRKDIFGNPIKRNISDNDVYKLYDDHHKELTRRVNCTLSLFENVLIVDAHSFEPQNDYDPDICLGTDYFHTPKSMIIELMKHFKDNGLSVDINHPFSGTLVPFHHYKKNKKVISVMIEVNKKSCVEDLEKMRNIIRDALSIIEKTGRR